MGGGADHLEPHSRVLRHPVCLRPEPPRHTATPLTPRCRACSFVGVVQANNPRLWSGPNPAHGRGALAAWKKFCCSCKKQYENDFAKEGPTNIIKLMLIPACYFIWTDFPIRALWHLTLNPKGTWGDQNVLEDWYAPLRTPRRHVLLAEPFHCCAGSS